MRQIKSMVPMGVQVVRPMESLSESACALDMKIFLVRHP